MTSLPIPPATAQRKGPRDPWGLGEIIDRLGPSMFVGLLMTDGTLIHANRAALDLASVRLADVLGVPFDQTVWWREAPQEQRRLREAIEMAAQGRSSRFEVELVTDRGELKIIDFSLQPVFDSDGSVAFLVPSGFDVSERRAAQAHALFLIEHDPLTGLLNRRALLTHLAVKVERCRKEGRRLAVLCIEVSGPNTTINLSPPMRASLSCLSKQDWIRSTTDRDANQRQEAYGERSARQACVFPY